jgi:hypothetical protein
MEMERTKVVMLVKIVCRRCGTMIGPLPLDGKPYLCKGCNWLVLGPDDAETKRRRKERGLG